VLCERDGGTAGSGEAGRKAVRLLNAILEPRLAKDPERLAAWRSAKRVRPTTAVTASDGAESAPSTIKVA
jgi:hypothetical protein